MEKTLMKQVRYKGKDGNWAWATPAKKAAAEKAAKPKKPSKPQKTEKEE